MISSPCHPVILRLSWVQTHNPTIDWQTQTITFPQTMSPLVPSPPGSSLSDVSITKPPPPQVRIFPLQAPAFLQEAQGEQIFAIYTTPVTSKDDSPQTTLPQKYADFQDVFNTKHADTLPEHHSYDC